MTIVTNDPAKTPQPQYLVQNGDIQVAHPAPARRCFGEFSGVIGVGLEFFETWSEQELAAWE